MSNRFLTLAFMIRRHCDLAQEFEAFVRADGRFEIMAKTHLGLVCFRLICEPSDDCNDVNRRLVDAINLEGSKKCCSYMALFLFLIYFLLFSYLPCAVADRRSRHYSFCVMQSSHELRARGNRVSFYSARHYYIPAESQDVGGVRPEANGLSYLPLCPFDFPIIAHYYCCRPAVVVASIGH